MKVAALLLAVLVPAHASDEMMTAFDPRPTPPEVAWRAGAEVRWYGDAEARDGNGSIGMDNQKANLSWLGLHGAEDEVWLNARAKRTGISGDALLASGGSPAGTYLDLGVGATWKHLLGGGNLIGVTGTAVREGQPGIDGGMELGGNALMFGRLGLGEEGRDGLLMAISYDADRLFFSNIPVLPMVAWQGIRGPWILLVGVPFSVITYRAEDWRMTAEIGPLPALSADRRITGPWRVFGDARWTRQQWRRAGRPEHDDRLELSQWEWSGGLRFALGPMLQVDLFGGAATARRLGEDSESQAARRDGIDLEAAPFAALRGRVTF